MRVLLHRGHHIEVSSSEFRVSSFVLGLRSYVLDYWCRRPHGKPSILFTIHDLPFTAFSDSRFTIYGLSGEMGETILTNAM